MGEPSASEATVFRSQDFFAVDGDRIAELKRVAQLSEKKRARICLHKSHDDLVQQMVIALVRGFPVPKHRQVTGHKTYFLIEGELSLEFFDDQGKSDALYILAGSRTTILTFPARRWHACEALSPVAVYLEVQPGPFDSTRTEWWR